jgi:hypothetical protein
MPLTTRGREDGVAGSGIGRLASSAASKIAAALTQKASKILNSL